MIRVRYWDSRPYLDERDDFYFDNSGGEIYILAPNVRGDQFYIHYFRPREMLSLPRNWILV